MTAPLRIGSTDRVFVLTGAGISAESGISTFRDAGGLWEKYRFEEVASPEGWAAHPADVWRFYAQRRAQAAGCEPNPAHRALAALERALGERLFLCTQNVDDLHEKGGSTRVHHMHGELFKSRCEACARPPFEDRVAHEAIPRCACGALRNRREQRRGLPGGGLRGVGRRSCANRVRGSRASGQRAGVRRVPPRPGRRGAAHAVRGGVGPRVTPRGGAPPISRAPRLPERWPRGRSRSRRARR